MFDNNSITKDDIEYEAEYIIKTGCTVRQAAKYFSASKSKIHKDVTVNLRKNGKFALADEVRKVLDKNKDERAMRGGEATRQKYELIRLKKAI